MSCDRDLWKRIVDFAHRLFHTAAARVCYIPQTVVLGTGFAATPIILARVESVANAKTVTSRVQAVTATDFQAVSAN